MIIALLILFFAGGLIAWLSTAFAQKAARWVSLIATLLAFIVTSLFWMNNAGAIGLSDNQWILDQTYPWIPQFGISFHFALDGLSLLMLWLTSLLGVLSVLTSWTEVKKQSGFYYFNMLWILAGITGVFTAMDLFLFYFFWEVMLIPMYFLIAIWGHERRQYAAYKFFIFTQAGGLLMFLAMLALYVLHGAETGTYTFDFFALLETDIPAAYAKWIFGGLLIGFIVKLPAVPFHSWLPDAHTQAPTAGSLILAGLLLKTGAYGLIRFVIPLFPDLIELFYIPGMILGIIGILYGAKLAFAQTDFKRLVAYTSVSHMGFVLLGVFAMNTLALQGVIIQMLAHGISTGALFIMAGLLQERLHTRDIEQMGGLWQRMPGMAGIGLLFAMASLGLPALGNFIAEILILLGTFQVDILMATLASIGLVAATIYSLRIMQKIFYGPLKTEELLPDLNPRESIIMGSMILVILWIGLYPQAFLDTSQASVDQVLLEKQTEQEEMEPERELKMQEDDE